MRRFGSLVRAVLPYRIAAAQGRRLLDRAAKADKAVYPDDERTVVVGDGTSAEEIAQKLYKRDLIAGGWLCDMGLWRGLYIRRAAKVINDRASQGHVPSDTPL